MVYLNLLYKILWSSKGGKRCGYVINESWKRNSRGWQFVSTATIFFSGLHPLHLFTVHMHACFRVAIATMPLEHWSIGALFSTSLYNFHPCNWWYGLRVKENKDEQQDLCVTKFVSIFLVEININVLINIWYFLNVVQKEGWVLSMWSCLNKHLFSCDRWLYFDLLGVIHSH